MEKNVVIVIPAYEPPSEMLTFLKELAKEQYKIIVIDDGSKEEFSALFEKASKYAVVLKNETNMGKGVALKKGFHYIQSHYKSAIIVTMDCDGQHTVADAKKLISYSQNHEDEIVLGKRLLLETTPLRSRLGNSITRFIYFLATGTYLYDTQTGLRAFHSHLLPFITRIPGMRFEYEMNMILYAASSNIKMTELEIETIYINHNSGSHFHTVKDSFKIYKEILRFKSPLLLSLLLDYVFFLGFFSLSQNFLFANAISILLAFFTYLLLIQKRKSLLFQQPSSFIQSVLFIILYLVLSTFLATIFQKLNLSIFLCKFIFLIIFLILLTFFRAFVCKNYKKS